MRHGKNVKEMIDGSGKKQKASNSDFKKMLIDNSGASNNNWQ